MQGHRRLIREVFSSDKQKVNEALRQSVNTIIQGTGAYFTNLAMVYLDEIIEAKGLRSKIVISVHDSIVLDCPMEEAELMADLGKWVMENLPIEWSFIDYKGEHLRYPIKADVEIGRDYGTLVDYDKEELSEYNSVDGYVKYHKDKAKLADYFNNGFLEEENYEQALQVIENNLPTYKLI